MAGKRLRCGLVMVMSPFLMLLDFRNGFDVFVDGVCCMYEKERRCTGPVESQCHGVYTQQNLPVSVPDVVTWAVFISKSCSSAGADGDVRPSWGWLLLLAVAGVFHSILFIVFVAFSSGNVTPALFLAYSLQWFSLCLFLAYSLQWFSLCLFPAMVQFVFGSCNGSVCVSCNGSVCVCFLQWFSLCLFPAMVQFVFVSCNGSVCVCFLQWFSLCLFPAMVQFVFVSCNGSVCVCFSLTACNGSVCVCFSLTACNGSVCVCFLQWFSLCLFPAMVQFVFVSHLQPAMVQFVFVSLLQPAMVQFVFVSWVSGRLGVLVYIEVWLFNIQKFELSKILFKEVSYSHRGWK